MKNSAELAGLREAHLRDGVALTRFLCWLEKTIASGGWVRAWMAWWEGASGCWLPTCNLQAGASRRHFYWERGPGDELTPTCSPALNLRAGRMLTEVEVDEELTARRAAQPGFVEPSFPTIAGACCMVLQGRVQGARRSVWQAGLA